MTERTGGVPLFIEEVTRLLLERGERGGVQAIPPTLQQSLAARLDRLGPAREIAQIGSVLGREFDRIGYRQFEAELHRVRGEMLLKRDPPNPAPAEEALQSAIAIAKQQGTRSFGLRAALALAKLYQSTGRPSDAYRVLAPALAGFRPHGGNARNR